jgi:hypothetical protein
MGVGYNPKIVTDGLILCLDAANPRCFGAAQTSAVNLISGGTVSGASGTPGTGANTPNVDYFPEYNSIYGGIFDFAGGRGMNCDEDLGAHTELTIDMWYYKAGTGSHYITDARNNGGQWFLSNYTSYNINYTGAATYNFDTAYDAANADFINRWQHLIITSDATSSKLYIDGTSRTLVANTSLNENLGVNFRIGTRYTTSGPWTGYMGPIKIYNKALTSAEAYNNFLSHRTRFGI